MVAGTPEAVAEHPSHTGRTQSRDWSGNRLVQWRFEHGAGGVGEGMRVAWVVACWWTTLEVALAVMQSAASKVVYNFHDD